MSHQPDLYRLLTETLCDTFDLPTSELRPEATFHELGLDSLCLAELAVTVEERTGFRMDDLTADHSLARAAEALATRLAPVAPHSS